MISGLPVKIFVLFVSWFFCLFVLAAWFEGIFVTRLEFNLSPWLRSVES